MRYHRIGHCDKVFIKKGDIVKKGQQIATIGTGNGQYSAHIHFDIPTKEIPWTSYVFGMSLEQVKELYANPEPFRPIIFPTFHHFGWKYLELATYGKKKCFHPGEDLNGKGAGNSDLGEPIYAPCDGEVVYCFDKAPTSKDSAKNYGWGKLLVIKEKPISPVGENGQYKQGIDISHHQKYIDWDKVKTDFIYLKATQGTDFLDEKYHEYKEAVRKKGIPLGHYHFAGKGFEDSNGKIYFVAQDPIKEADWFLKNIDFKLEDDLILDWEIEYKDPVDWCKKFINRVKEKTGKNCWLYTNDYRALKYNFPKEWNFWIARYADYTGNYYPYFEPRFKNWKIHQYTSRGKVEGIKDGNKDWVDMNVMKQKEPISLCNEPSDNQGFEIQEDGTITTSDEVVVADNSNNNNNMQEKILSTKRL